MRISATKCLRYKRLLSADVLSVSGHSSNGVMDFRWERLPADREYKKYDEYEPNQEGQDG